MSLLGQRLIAVHDALAQARLPHAIGGAIALAYCTLQPRGTRDLDVNVFLTRDRVQEVRAALPAPVAFSAADVERVERDGQTRLWWEDTPIDIFLNVLPFHDHVAKGVRHVPFEGRTIPVLGCEALAVFKAMFDRTRDWADIEAMVQAGSIDVAETAARVRELDGPDSSRAERLLTHTV
jgi:hypothetical protein